MAVTGTGTMVLNFSASGDAFNGFHFWESCRWIGATAAGHVCRIEDLSGHLVFLSIADGANFVDGWVFAGKSTNGITIASMNSGSFQMYMT